MLVACCPASPPQLQKKTVNAERQSIRFMLSPRLGIGRTHYYGSAPIVHLFPGMPSTFFAGMSCEGRSSFGLRALEADIFMKRKNLIPGNCYFFNA